MNTLLINNRRYTCELWELMSWDKLHAILRYDEQRRRSDRQSVDRLTAELLTKIAGVRRPLAYRTDPDDRILVAERLVSYLPHELRRLENMLSDETRSPGKKANRNNRLPPEDETDWEGSPIPMSRITASPESNGPTGCSAKPIRSVTSSRRAGRPATIRNKVRGATCWHGPGTMSQGKSNGRVR